MLRPKDLARGKLAMSARDLSALTGAYSYRTQRRWNGQDVELIAFSMKSSTRWDGESSTGEGPDDR